jgi:hypothetical protein
LLPKPYSGCSAFFKSSFLKPMPVKHYQVKMSAELPLSTRILPMSLPN